MAKNYVASSWRNLSQQNVIHPNRQSESYA